MSTPPLRIGIAVDLRSDFAEPASGPDDLLEEYDSEATVEAVARVLSGRGHRVEVLGGGHRLVRALLDDPPDLVFNLCEGTGSRSREAHAAAVCEMLGVRYSHSDPLTLAAALDKDVAKRLVASFGVPTPRHVCCAEAPFDAATLAGLRLPLIAKPVAEGSSIGIRGLCRIDDAAHVEPTVHRLLADYRQPVLVEEFCPGTEITVGVIGTGADARVLGSMEIELVGSDTADFVYSVDVKRAFRERVRYHVPPRTHRHDAEQVALAAHRALGCRDVSRVDLRVDASGNVAFLEINPIPGVAPGYSDLVIMAERLGWSHDDVVTAIVDQAWARGR